MKINRQSESPASDEVGRRLLDQAIGESPAFSPALHARIMRRIRQSDRGDAHFAEVVPRRINWHLLTAVAASLAVVAGLSFAILSSRTAARPHVAVNAGDALPTMEVHFPSLAQPAVLDARYGYLDHDAKNLARYVMNQIDFVPNG